MYRGAARRRGHQRHPDGARARGPAHAAAEYRGEDVGVHLTLNAEYDLYRWGPITYGPSLLDGDGGFPRTVTDVWDHADLDEVRRELRAQVERAILWGFDVTHLDSHMGTLQLKPEFFDIYLDLAVEFGLPLRLSGASTERPSGFPFRDRAAEEGVVFPDHFVRGPRASGSRASIMAAVDDLRPGVTEMYVHPAVDTPELRGLRPRLGGPGRRPRPDVPTTPSCATRLDARRRPPDRLPRRCATSSARPQRADARRRSALDVERRVLGRLAATLSWMALYSGLLRRAASAP